MASVLGAASHASDWFRGGIVAYATTVKQRLLGVRPGPVVSAECAEQMAARAGELLEADMTVSTTGAGGPDPQDGQPIGTVFIAIHSAKTVSSAEYRFAGDPAAVVQQSVSAALQQLLTALEKGPGA